MIRYLDGNEKAGSRDLWEEAFPEDSKSFDDYYFGEKLKDNRILVLEEDQETDGVRIASMIHLNPYKVRAAGGQWRVDYLVGVATRKDRRHRGYMRRLLGRMMEDMRREGMPFCFLMPADEAIYRPFGFTYIYRQPSVRLKDGAELEEREILAVGSRQENQTGQWEGAGWGGTDLPDCQELSVWMNDWLQSRYEVFAIRDEAYVCRLLKELASENGNFRLLYDGNILAGMISEWGFDKREQRLLYCGNAYVEEAGEPKPAIMARIITPENFVRVIRLKETYAGEELTVCLELADPLIPENDGLWLWHLDKGSSWMERQPGKPMEDDISSPSAGAEDMGKMEPEGGIHGVLSSGAARENRGTAAGRPELSLTIEEFTFWLFGYGVPEAVAGLGLDKVVRTLQGVFLDEVV